MKGSRSGHVSSACRSDPTLATLQAINHRSCYLPPSCRALLLFGPPLGPTRWNNNLDYPPGYSGSTGARLLLVSQSAVVASLPVLQMPRYVIGKVRFLVATISPLFFFFLHFLFSSQSYFTRGISSYS
ncbi:hypothetical protein ASPBRDRAFT_484724 [Aspergillus brasiliensis CBS 101740]|uniref:Uncharacterized protein n=1 Tax=Aspergillus brasiliensis (strain CBS 101740 / IMI 381727 / IBT 21946) TaxID=767769 RepID=A0A1L9UUS5_ASPBC|nr:hypothetical protein ASPBRDRAFT_484724 [Aspergillus brasiliensis CBS 101740]